MTREEIVDGAREVIHQGSKSFRAASRLFDPLTRERAWLLYSWCRYCDDVADGQTFGFGRGIRGNVGVLRGKTRRAAAGEELPELPFRALTQVLSECPIPMRFIEDHLRGFSLDEAGWQPQSTEELNRYCYYVAGTVGCMMAVVMGVPVDDEDTLERAAELGVAFQLSNIARDIREDSEAGRCYLPLNWLAEFGIAQAALLEPDNRIALTQMVRRLVDSAIAHEKSARRGVAKLPFRSRLAVLTALRIYGAIGRRVVKLGPTAWDGRVSIGKVRKLTFLAPSLVEALVPLRR